MPPHGPSEDARLLDWSSLVATTVAARSHAAIAGLDRQGRVRSWSEGAAELFGFDEAAILGRFVPDLVPGGEAVVAAYLEEVVGGTAVHLDSARVLTGNGETVAVAVDLWPVRGEDGQVVGIAVQTARVPDRKDGDGGRPIGYWTYHRVGTHEQIEITQGVTSLTGLTQDDLDRHGAQALLDVVHPADRETAAELWSLVNRGESEVETELRITRPDGELRWMRMRSDSVVSTGEEVRIVGSLRDVTLDREYLHHVLSPALHDPLTALPNRRLLTDRLEVRLRNQPGLALVTVDVDNFHLIRGRFGEAVGDELMLACAARLTAVIGDRSLVGRIGVDEFAIIGAGITTDDGAMALGQRVSDVFAEPFVLGGVEVFVTASVGVALGPGPGRAEALLARADNSLHEAKRRGGARIEMWDAGAVARRERVAEVSDLRRAVARQEFPIVYQPIVDLRRGGVIGVEALLRWPEEPGAAGPAVGRRALAHQPDRFVALAESTGLIVPLGDQVLRRVCAQLAEWQRDIPGLPADFSVNVNVSARQLEGTELVDSVIDAVRTAGIDPRQLTLEVTETALMVDVDLAIAALTGLRASGVRLTIDDFGTGYSSLAYLRRFPLDALKIDRSFVIGLPDGHDRAIITAIVAMARSFGLDVVAEGVETPTQAAVVRQLGCTYAQGFHYYRPLASADIPAVFQTAARAVGGH